MRRSPDYWRNNWAYPPVDIDLSTENEKREKTGFISIVTWPLVLLILQGSVFAPLYGSGFLGSPFDSEGGATVQGDPEMAIENLPIEEPDTVAEEDTPEATPSPSGSSTPLPSGSAAPAPIPGASTDDGGNSTVPTPARTSAPRNIQPSTPTTPEVPPVVELDLVPGGSTKVSMSGIKMFPGQTQLAYFKTINKGNVPLGKLNMSLSTSNRLFADSSQGIEATVWTCAAAWGGTSKQPSCSTGAVQVGNMKMGSRELNLEAGAPGTERNLAIFFKLPTSADDRFQKASTTLTIQMTAQQTGGVQ